MSSTNAPFGMRAAYSPSGIIRPVASTITSGYNTDIYTGQPVKIGTMAPLKLLLLANASSALLLVASISPLVHSVR